MVAKRRLPGKPKLKTYFNWIPMGGDVVQVRSLENIFIMKGKSVVEILPKLIPLLDGTNTIDNLIEKLPEIDGEVIKETILRFTQHFLIEDADNRKMLDLSEEEIEHAGKQLEFFSHFADRQLPNGETINKYQLLVSLKNSGILVIGLGNLGAAVINSLAVLNIGKLYGYDFGLVDFSDVGVFYKKDDVGTARVQASGRIARSANKYVAYEGCDITGGRDEELERLISMADFIVLSADIPLKSLYEKVNMLCIKHDKPWISARTGETEMELGPIVIPRQTPCFDCYTSRVNGNMSFFNENMAFEAYKEENIDKIKPVSIEQTYSIMANMLSIEAMKFLTNILYPVCISRVLTFNIITMETTASSILKIPRCKSCGSLTEAPSTAPYAVFLP